MEETMTPNANNEPIVLYICDRKMCGDICYPDCRHTTDVKHAKNFKVDGEYFIEEEKDE